MKLPGRPLRKLSRVALPVARALVSGGPLASVALAAAGKLLGTAPDPAEVEQALESRTDWWDALESVNKQFVVDTYDQGMESELLALEAKAIAEREQTSRAEIGEQPSWWRENARPIIAVIAATAGVGLAYMIAIRVLWYGESISMDGVMVWLVATILSPTLAYMGVRTIDKIGKRQ